MSALQRLAALGLPDRVAFPEFVSLISEVAPFDTAAMLWLDADYRPIDTYITVDAGPELITRYATRWFDAEEGQYYPRQREMQLNPALSVIRVSDYTPAFGETELYDEVYRRGEHHWIAGLALRDGDRPIGNLGVARPPKARDFTDHEMRLLRLVRPYIVQAMGRLEAQDAWPDTDLEDAAAILVTDLEGGVLHASPGAWRLLHGAAGVPADLAVLRDRVYDWARPMLKTLASRVEEGLAGAGSGVARTDTVTAYGRFVIRAYALSANTEGEARTVGVQIEKRLPVGLKMLRSPLFRSLTPREQEVARMLATGMSYPVIGDRLGMGASTVVTHVRNLGHKLGVGSREEIVGALCA
ncbi:MAG: helix-turn-helix transcriptional regulator [Phenylobacterium sp.]|uniref:helix-turn-helix transcriptional regulator n=1 Tax=Phenylobacterium sp. TaxID=1871053 RepID=UPI001A5ACFAA|nr:helix-turn-helix transcriptional regulator [Phenylobacterium sp.]MBL8770571.1 helix-turn-helix transcriptional regulator [Phenylobacterium sp.]